MLRRASWIAILLLTSACTQVPTDVSIPTAAEPTPSGPSANVEPSSKECKNAELSACADSCWDADCLAWCAGESCAAVIASLWSCMGEAERRFAAEHPKPAVEPERQSAWKAAREDAMYEHWDGSCHASCEDRVLASEGEGVVQFCADWPSTYGSWPRLSQPAPEHEGEFHLEEIPPEEKGTSVWLTGPLAENRTDRRIAALRLLVDRAGSQLQEAEHCVPDLSEYGSEFRLVVQFDASGAVQAAHVQEAQDGGGECVAKQLAAVLRLPIRVARDYPQLEVGVDVRPSPDVGEDGDDDGY
jgi:hypothetical protein